MAAVMLIALAVILGSLAMIDRATSGFLGSLFVGQSREARDAAEIGLARVVSQLNRSRNRRLLVNAEILARQGMTLAAIDANSTLASRCGTSTSDLTGSANAGSRGEFGTGSLLGTRRDIDAATRPGSGTIRSYEVLAITQPPDSREYNIDTAGQYAANEAFAVRLGQGANSARAGEVTITVRGLVRRGDTLVAATTIAGTFDVVPKCCGGSFRGAGNAFGNDTRPCEVTSLGVVTATSQELPPGGLLAAGSAVSFNAEDQSSLPLPYVICVTAGCAEASNLNSNTGTVVKQEASIDIDYNEIRNKFTGVTAQSSGPLPEPGPIAAGAPISLSNLKVGGAPYTLAANTLSLDTRNFSSWPDEFKAACREVSEYNGLAAIHCSITKLDFGANNRTIAVTTSSASSRKPLRLYFPNSQANQAEKTIDQRNNGSFTHLSEASGGNRVTDLMLIGNDISRENASCPPTNQRQIVDLANGTSQTLRLFAYFRCGTVNIGGNGGYTGILWANRVVANGSISFVSPNDAINQVLAFTSQSNPLVDWVARSMRSLDLF